jgi:hypothetical protein
MGSTLEPPTCCWHNHADKAEQIGWEWDAQKLLALLTSKRSKVVLDDYIGLWYRIKPLDISPQ